MKSTSEKIEFLQKTFGSIKAARDGVNIAVKCPACNEKKGKFSINIDSWVCHCWICGVKSKNLFFILRKHISNDSANKFAKMFGNPDINSNSQIKAEIEKIIELPEDFLHLASYTGFDPDVRDVIGYCKSRDITNKDMWYFGIGTGIRSKFKRRIIVPSFDNNGVLNYFVSRTIDTNGFPKYLNAPSKKTEIIFNEINIDWNSELTLVEGVFDLMKAGRNSTCLLGSKLSKNSRLFSKIIKNRTPILLALDVDMRSESDKIARSLSSIGCNVRVLNNKTNKDVGEMAREEFKIISKNSSLWSRDSSLKLKIRSLESGSII